jgi:hypothetical protein
VLALEPASAFLPESTFSYFHRFDVKAENLAVLDLCEATIAQETIPVDALDKHGTTSGDPMWRKGPSH